MHRLEFEDGVKTADETEKIKKGGKKHGTIVSFIPNVKYFGKGSKLPFDRVCSWFDEISHQISEGITIKVNEVNGFEQISTHKYKSKPFAKYITRVMGETGQKVGDPLSFSGDDTIEEEILDATIGKDEKVKAKQKKVKKDIHLDVVFTYQDDLITSYHSFCNFTRTDEGGVHVDSVEEILCRFLQEKTKENMSEKEKEKWNITWADVKEGLKLAINLSTNAQVQFMGNAKNKIQNEELKPILKAMVQEKLNALYSSNASKFQPILTFIKANARARIEANKTRIASKRNSMGRLDHYTNENYVTCNNKGKEYKELYTVEGKKSAMGAVADARFSTDFQAVYGFRGCTINPYKVPLHKLMENEEIRRFVDVLQCGIGPTFNLDKLYFDKIILGSDADVDGFYISMGIASLFVLYFPEIVKAGKLYKVFPPLYKLDEKGHEYVTNKSELAEVFMEKVSRKYKLGLATESWLNKTGMLELLYDTSNYLSNYSIELHDYYKVNMYLIEIVAATLVEMGIIRSAKDYDDIPTAMKNQKVITTLMNRVQKRFPELRLKENNINGPMDGHFGSFELNNRLPKKIAELIPIYQQYGHEVVVQRKKGDNEIRRMTLLEFLAEIDVLLPNKLKRYKGLGEGLPEEIEQTTMNPDNRLLVRLTMEDCERALQRFWKLQGARKEDLLARKLMMQEYEILPEYIDT